MRKIVLLAAVVVVAAATPDTFAGSGDVAAPRPTSEVTVWPTPREVERLGPDVSVPGEAVVEAGEQISQHTWQIALDALSQAGVLHQKIIRPGGPIDADAFLVRFRTDAAVPAEGYVVDVRDSGVSITSSDEAGAFHGAQTLLRLARPGAIPGVRITDHPSLPVRGIVEGFYGRPWTHAERLDQLRFAAAVKLNAYVYAPKDDPYHRARWADPYPSARLAELGQLADVAASVQIRFTYALAPGTTICYSDPAHLHALAAKIGLLHGAGVRSFALPLDDIEYARWNCPGDLAKYGPPGPAAAARAQTDLLNRVQRDVLAGLDGVAPLQTVPTEYSDVADSPYKKAFRENLDERVVLMWTGTAIVPAAITADEAAAAGAVWGRKPLVWDNYPVNDYPDAAGRLLLGPYTGRAAGMGVTGVLSNPMNQACASRGALFGLADFAWNDTAYDPDRALRAHASSLAGGDQRETEALLAFFDLNTRRSPVLARKISDFQIAWNSGDRHRAVAGLRAYAVTIADAPKLIRDECFAREARVWLDATERWGRALLAALDGLDGDRARFAESAKLVAEAGTAVKVGDGVLDRFLALTPGL
ncbi:beta-N-acetylglucosaminidase [Lentzea tibetensis]|uniref:Beta-N-acetylglucosaminidase n=1 Tax=Lentzea tibetensis TaxID=2591470 RepID=A0A563EUL8_9PSEU|nr:beta-N-acetylglucosaminidase domain-containing protein [Lentzea tibetensis]TWP51282.1 beta-N-acetylglucosaminidase [Lentzea tibetensis]